MDDYTTDGINNWCLANAGKKIAMQFKPTTDPTVMGYTFDATITPIGIGGDVKAKNTQEISWPISNLQNLPNSAN